MRKVILFFFICLSAKAFSQDISSVDKINFYGVDFSAASFYGLEESWKTIKNGLCDINALLKREQKKYDIEKYFKKSLGSYCLESADADNEAMNVEAMITNSKDQLKISPEQIEIIVNNLSCSEGNGTGLVFIAESLDKPNTKASYYIVFFKEDTKEIIYSKNVVEKAGGFGFRNYWASTIYKIMKDWKYKK
ncbi:hypothetical protein AGMMS50239_17780 [Bacteroidia bacterium]|nr:hypothetical protein AGMMS50239_17780 [Bacteroidia bacterium]